MTEEEYEFQSIADVPIPEDITPSERAEYIAYKECLIQIENEWKQVKNNEYEYQREATKMLQAKFEKRGEKQEMRKKFRLEVVERQCEKEFDHIKTECEDAKKALFERLVRGYYQAYRHITSRLKELMGKDYQAYIELNRIEFPSIAVDSQMKTRYQQPEETKARINSHDTEQELKEVDEMFKKYNKIYGLQYPNSEKNEQGQIEGQFQINQDEINEDEEIDHEEQEIEENEQEIMEQESEHEEQENDEENDNNNDELENKASEEREDEDHQNDGEQENGEHTQYDDQEKTEENENEAQENDGNLSDGDHEDVEKDE